MLEFLSRISGVDFDNGLALGGRSWLSVQTCHIQIETLVLSARGPCSRMLARVTRNELQEWDNGNRFATVSGASIAADRQAH